ncbi:MAG: type IV secretory system conjugative DNA transfer family protein, partial [Butyrivibrio sp.]|nr:type IV secretory system conjugative DNA transfer family protein [Butyrivibrio sp.]
KETIDTRSRNRTRGRQGSTSENDGILGRELMTVDELKIMKDNECILFVRGIYPFFCNKFIIEKHPNYKRLEDSDPDNAYLIKDIETVKINDEPEAESGENIYSEPVEDTEKEGGAAENPKQSTRNSSSEEVRTQDDIDRSVTIEEIIGGRVHTANPLKAFPKDPKSGTVAASLDDLDMVVTAEPHLRPPYTEVSEESYLDDWDTI